MRFGEFNLGDFNAEFGHALQNFGTFQDGKDELSVTITITIIVSGRSTTPVIGM
jgi:hypothetical protein